METRNGRGLALTVGIDGEHVVLSLSGEIDADNAALLPPAASAAVAGDKSLRIDFSAVTFMDSGALRQLLICEACLERDGVDVKVRCVPDHVRRLLDIAHLSHLIEEERQELAVT